MEHLNLDPNPTDTADRMHYKNRAQANSGHLSRICVPITIQAARPKNQKWRMAITDIFFVL